MSRQSDGLHHGINQWQYCPFCAIRLPIDGASPTEATDHLLKCQREAAERADNPEQLSLDEGAESEGEMEGK